MADLNSTIVRGNLRVTDDENVNGSLAVNGTITGNGSGLTNLNASNLASGTVPSGRLPSGSDSQAGILQLGTTATTAAKGNHTHTLVIRNSSDNADVANLAANTSYILKAGGSSYTFKTPANDGNTNYYAKSDFTSSNGTKIATGYSSGTASTTYDLYAPNATTSQAGLVTTGDQTFAGSKSFNGSINLSKNGVNWGTLGISDNKFTISSAANVLLSGYDLTLGNTSSKNLKIVISSTNSTSGFIFTDKYTAPNTTNIVTATYGFQTNKSSDGSYTIATTDDLSGFVTGPASATDGNIAIYNGTTGKIIKDSTIKTSTGGSSMSITLPRGESSLYLGESTGSSYVCLTNSEGAGPSGQTGLWHYITDKISNNTYYHYLPKKTGILATTDDLTGFVHLGTSSSSSNETIYGTKTFYDTVVASQSTSSTGSWLGNDGTLTLKKGSGSDSPAYIDFTGVSGNSGTVRLKSSVLTSGTATVVIPAANGTLIVENSNSHQAKVTDGWMAGTNPYAIYRSRSIELGTSSNPATILNIPTTAGTHTLLTDADLESFAIVTSSTITGGIEIQYGNSTYTALSGSTPLFRLNGTSSTSNKTASSLATFYAPTATSTTGYHWYWNGTTPSATSCTYRNSSLPSGDHTLACWGDASNTAGNVLLYATNTAIKVNGSSLYATYFYGTSDARLKENITDAAVDCSKIINNIKLREFSWKADDEHKLVLGAIAQELREAIPEKYQHEFIGGEETEEKYLSINDNKLVYIAIGALKEQQQEIKDLKNDINELKLLVNQLYENNK